MNTKFLKILTTSCLAALLAIAAKADRFELKNGSTVVGKLLSAENGKFVVETDFAGKIEIVQDQLKSFTTDEPVNVALKSGSNVLGPVAATDSGLRVTATGGEMSASTGDVVAVWRQGDDSPSARALKAAARKWAYEASLALAGRTGPSEKFGLAMGFKATLASPQDKLVFDLQAERAQDNGVKTADRQFGGVDYSAFFTEKNGWYARTSLEKDKIKSIDLRSTTAFGYSRRAIKNDKQELELRAGVNYLYETYSDDTKFSSPGLDFTLLHSYIFGTSRMTNMLSYTPAFKEFSNYRLHHESAFEIPITAALWKLKLGIANDYQSVPAPGIERLDTTYFTSLILNWQ